MALLSVRNLCTRFYTQDGVVNAVNGISYDIEEGETLGIVGESGCGKSVGVLSVMRLVPQPPGAIEGGEVWFDGKDLLTLPEEDMRALRGYRLAMIFQDPLTSLNPVLTIGQQVSETLEVHLGLNKQDARVRTAELLEMVGIPRASDRFGDFPHQFSGGMRQRVMIAMALACRPQLLIADEPTTALDVTIQAQITDLVKRFRDEFGMAMIWITHDLGVVAGLADRVLVMYAGYVIESAAVDDLYEHPTHPYTLGLLGSVPRLDAAHKGRLTPIDGAPPDMMQIPAGCPFLPRCQYAVDRCRAGNPTLRQVGGGHEVACWVDVASGRG